MWSGNEYAEQIKGAGWWKGTMQQWYDQTPSEREALSFVNTGCKIACCTWKGPVECLHSVCMIARGEKPPLYQTECVLNHERSGWLRWLSEDDYQALRTEILAECARTGVYDPWHLPGGWQMFVGAALKDVL